MDLIFPIPWANSGDKEVVPQSARSDGRVSFEVGFGPDYEKDLLKDPDAKNIERKKLNYILNQLCEAINVLSKKDGLPVGMPIPWPSLVMPEGNFLAMDGRDFPREQNPKLLAVYPSGKTPDLRGVAIRGLDNGRLLDPGRGLLTYQDDAMQRISGIFPTDSFANNFTGCFYNAGGAGRQSASGHGGATYCGFDSARQTKTAAETRMKNIAFYYITKGG